MCRLLGLARREFDEVRELMVYVHKTGRWLQEPRKDARGQILRDPKTKKPLMRSVPEIKREHLMDKACRFPTGLLYLLQGWLEKSGRDWEETDLRERPGTRPADAPSMFKPGVAPVPYLEQLEAAVAGVTHGRGILVAPTGVGKSLIAALICDMLQCRTLIVVPKLGLKQQLTESLQEFFGVNAVGPLVKGQATHWITVENVDALRGKSPRIDAVLIDEFHRAGAKGYRTLNQKAWTEVYFKLGLTATPFRSRTEERVLLESVLSQVIYRVTYKQAVAKKYIVPVEAYYYDLPVKKRVKANSWQGVYKELVTENGYRNRLIAHLMGNVVEAGQSALTLTKQVLHGETIEELLRQRGLDVPFAEGKKGDVNRELLRAFNAQEKLGLIGTSGIMGEGQDTKPCEWVFLAGLGKSKNQFMQQVGRGVRRFGAKESCKVIIFRDESHKWTLSHFDEQVMYLRQEYGIEPVKLELPENI